MTHILEPTIIPAAGTKPKIIEEFIGKVNSGTDEVSIARMTSPPGWVEPAQAPDFDEYTLVLKGTLKILMEGREILVRENEAFVSPKGVEVQYSTPGPGETEYIAICVPAFTPERVHRME